MTKKFDSSQMLPLFKIISSNYEEPAVLVQHKQRKKDKRPDVQVHRTQNNVVNNVSIHKNPDKISEHSSSNKVKKKHLIRENDRIVFENQKLNEQLTLTKNTLTKRESQIVKLKDKISSIQTISEKLANENNIIKTQYEDILVSLDELRNQLKKKKCQPCDENKEILNIKLIDLENTKTTNKRLTNDLNMLKNVVYRLNVELERYQSKIQNPNDISSTTEFKTPTIFHKIFEPDILDHHDHIHTPMTWGSVNTHTLGPLLDAYQDALAEKNDIIKTYENKMIHFTRKLKVITEENEMLHKKKIESTEIVEKSTKELESNRKELKTIKDQNDLLKRKCTLKHDKIQDIIKCYDRKSKLNTKWFNLYLNEHDQISCEYLDKKSENKYSIFVRELLSH